MTFTLSHKEAFPDKHRVERTGSKGDGIKMSSTAPWLALATDWMDSEMFDGATHGERLAWVCLLCHAKSQGRGGRVRLRKNAFQTTYRLSERAVVGMLNRAQKCAAIEINGDFVTLCNWRAYQAKASKAGAGQTPHSPEIEKNSPTKHTSPSTKHKTSTEVPPAKRARPRDQIWDAIEGLFFPTGVPPGQKSRVGRIVRDLKAIGSTPDGIKLAYQTAKANWPHVFGPEAIAKHYHALVGGDESQPRKSPEELAQLLTEIMEDED